MSGTTVSETVRIIRDCTLPDLEEHVRQNPRALEQKDEIGRVALHYAIEFPLESLHKFEFLVVSNPAAALVQDKYGKTPLHCTVDHPWDVPEGFIEVLLRHGRGTASIKDSNGRLPLHCLVRGLHEDGAHKIQLLLDAYPQAIQETCERGELPLLSAVGAESEVIEVLYNAYPEAISATDPLGNTVAHRAAESYDAGESDDDFSALRFLLQTYPGTSIPNKKGHHPIHCTFVAQDSCQSLATLKLLHERFPSALTTRLPDGSNFLHFLVCTNAVDCLTCDENFDWIVKIFDWIVEQDPAAPTTVDEAGNTPLHHALKRQFNYEFLDTRSVKHLVEFNPEVLQFENKDGDLPLHCAICNSDENELATIQYLIETFPQGARHRNSAGQLPLHLVGHICPEEQKSVIDMLIKAYPRALDMRDPEYFVFPFMLGSLHASVDMTFDLLRAKPEVLVSLCSAKKTDK